MLIEDSSRKLTVSGDSPTHDNSGVLLQASQQEVEHFTANVVKIYI